MSQKGDEKGAGQVEPNLSTPRSKHDLETTRSSDDVEQVDDEDESFTAGDDAAGAAASVAEVRRDRESTSSPDPHAGHTLFPSPDHFSGTETEAEGLASIPGGVEFAPVAPGDSDVVHDRPTAGGGLGTVADRDVVDHEIGGRSALGNGDGGFGRVVSLGATLGVREFRFRFGQVDFGRT
jgi:hypothetical protein